MGIIDCPIIKEEVDDEFYGYYSENERTSVKLTVSSQYKEIFEKFKTYMESEIQEIGDKTLEQEVEILEKILK